jgi:hypothetical protein
LLLAAPMLHAVGWIICFTFCNKSNVLTASLPSGLRIYILFLLQVRFVTASVRLGRCAVEVGSFVLSVFLTSVSRTGHLLAPWNSWYMKRLLVYEDREKSRFSRFLPFVIVDFITLVSITRDCFWEIVMRPSGWQPAIPSLLTLLRPHSTPSSTIRSCFRAVCN